LKFSIKRIRKRSRVSDNGFTDIGDELFRKGKWISLVNQETGQGRRVRLYLKVRPLLICLGGLLVAGYLSAAVALTWWLDRNQFNKVGFFDVAMPWRWSTLNELRAAGFGEQGAAELLNGQPQRGHFYLQRSLGLNPKNESVRLELAKYYSEANYYPGLVRVVKPQLKIGYSRPLLDILLPQAAGADDLELVTAVTEQMRPWVADDAEQREWLDDWRVRNLLELKDGEAILELLAEHGYAGSKWDIYKINALIELGDLDAALATANAMPPAFPGMFPLALRMQAHVLSARKNREALLAKLEVLLQEARLVPEPWGFAIEMLVRAELFDDTATFIGDYLTRFGADPAVVNQLVQRVVNTNSARGTTLLFRRITEWQQPVSTQRVAYAFTLIGEADWAQLEAEFGRGVGDEFTDDFILPLVQALHAATTDETGSDELSAWLGGRGLQLNLYRFLIRGLSKDEQWSLVKMVAETGRRVHPSSYSLAAALTEAETHLAEVAPDMRVVEAVASTRKTFDESDVRKLKYDLAGLVKDDKWTDVETLVLQVRRQRAAWLSEIEPELDEADAEAGAARDDWERLTRLAPAVLRRNPERMEWFLDQLDRAVAQGETKRALRLVEEILRVERINYRAHQVWKKLTAPVDLVGEPDAGAGVSGVEAEETLPGLPQP
jgi:hypothetical protein